MADEDKLDKLIDNESREHPAPMLQMDGIRIATLITLGAHTVAMVVVTAFLVTNVHTQRETNECYQRQIEALTTWASTAVQAGRSDRQAQRELLLSDGTLSPAEARKKYLDKLDEADRTRSTAPVPAQRCAG